MVPSRGDDLDIKEVKAKTTTNNIASQKVLEQNGFEHIETSDKEFEMDGQMLKFITYTWTNKPLFNHQSDAAV
ncbi:GNAT family protein [Paenibacillus sp. FSL F4-0087]|uniref:GNAT family N-acetyltransferase n=1 Tax=Paenibacillus sp. FSL F4-0087 TaxID=2921368 RepID=UPI0030F9F7B7